MIVGCTTVCAHALGCGPDTSGFGGQTTIAAGPTLALTVGALHAISGAPVAIGQDQFGIYAMSLLCTHQGCDMSNGVSSSYISCGCHGSIFDAQGKVLRGPALSPLEHFVVTEDAAGQLTVHLDETTASSTRLGA